MRIEKDYEEFLRLLNRHKAKYLIIGSFAVAFYAKPRYTKDIDILVEPSLENGKRIVKALKEFGFGTLDLKDKDFAKKGNIIQLGYEPVRIDIMTSLEGENFSSVWKKRKLGEYGNKKVFFIGLEDLIRVKKKSKRRIDKVDLSILSKVKGGRHLWSEK